MVMVVMVVGNRQLRLFILMHEAAHGLLHPSRLVNDRVARWFCGHELVVHRFYHLQHHHSVQQSEDPDLALSAPFPISRGSLRRKIIRDLTGHTFFKQRLGTLQRQLKNRALGVGIWPLAMAEVKNQYVFLLANAIALAVFSAASWG